MPAARIVTAASIIGLCLVVAAPTRACAQPALEAGRWSDVAPLVHPRALAHFRAEQVSRLRGMMQPPDRRPPPDTTNAAAMAAWRDALREMEAMGSPRGDTTVLDSLRARGDTLFFGLMPEFMTQRPPRTVMGSIVENDSTMRRSSRTPPSAC